MLLAVGELDIRKIIDGFLLMAENKNEEHELNQDNKEYLHNDGWGVLLMKNGQFEVYRSGKPCWKDDKIKDLYSVEADLIMLHARRASSKKFLGEEFAHPFNIDGWYFCHNGTIYDSNLPNDMSDSQWLFNRLLNNINRSADIINAIKKVVEEFKEYSSLNFFLVGDGKAYVLNRFKKYPKFYTLKYLMDDRKLIVSSERLLNIQGLWKEIGDKRVLTIEIKSRKVTFEKL